MAYNGTYLSAMSDRCGALGMRKWLYDTTDTITTVGTASYISDAADTDATTAKEGKKGLRKGDIVCVRQWSALPDEFGDLITAFGTAPNLVTISEFVVAGIVQATGAADLSLNWTVDVVAANVD